MTRTTRGGKSFNGWANNPLISVHKYVQVYLRAKTRVIASYESHNQRRKIECRCSQKAGKRKKDVKSRNLKVGSYQRRVKYFRYLKEERSAYCYFTRLNPIWTHNGWNPSLSSIITTERHDEQKHVTCTYNVDIIAFNDRMYLRSTLQFSYFVDPISGTNYNQSP